VAELAVVIPTFNERENVPFVLEALERDLAGISWEVLFVDDDSADGTAAYLRERAQKDPAIRVLQRVGRAGLASACIEGMMATAAPFIAVMDADLQHDSRLLRPMVEALRRQPVDIVCGSRYMDGGSLGAWTGTRQRMSQLATWTCRKLLRVTLTDPMSGFFMLRREYLDRVVHNLSAQGFKILLDLVTATESQARVLELPFRFGIRQHGESKLDSLVIVEFGLMLIERRMPLIPLRFLQFMGVGMIGVVIHLAVLGGILHFFDNHFLRAQAGATLVAMTVNFHFNNVFTYRRNKLAGARFFRGLMSFYLACAVGSVANLAVARELYSGGMPWWFAGLIGAVIGGVWNYAVSSTFTWGEKARS
jgi:dolichol-phosphate mannosyltransferase